MSLAGRSGGFWREEVAAVNVATGQAEGFEPTGEVWDQTEDGAHYEDVWARPWCLIKVQRPGSSSV